jgi:hypothetical protein
MKMAIAIPQSSSNNIDPPLITDRGFSWLIVQSFCAGALA